MHYDWQASLALLALAIILTKIGKWLAFSIPALAKARALNLDADKAKIATEKYPPIIAATRKIGLVTNLLFFVAIAPFFLTLSAQPVSEILLGIVVILMVYDFFYYLTHRFVFHGQSFMRQVHALHHQARNPTHIDAYYVHPLETFIGITLFMGTIALLGFFMGPFHIVTVAIPYVIFQQLNIVNHTHVDLDKSPFKTLSWITAKHAIHHENMQKGNYATITLLYDKLFGTFD